MPNYIMGSLRGAAVSRRQAAAHDERKGRRRARIWFAAFAMFVVAAMTLPWMLGAPADVVSIIGLTALILMTLPGTVLTLLVAGRLEVARTRASVLATRVRHGVGVAWAAAAFTLGAWLASLMAMDLGRLASADADADPFAYLLRVLALFAVPILGAAWMAVSVPAAWAVCSAGEDRRTKALLRGLPAKARDSLSPTARTWLADVDRTGRMPALADPSLERRIRWLGSDSCARVSALLTAAFGICVLLLAMQLLPT